MITPPGAARIVSGVLLGPGEEAMRNSDLARSRRRFAASMLAGDAPASTASPEALAMLDPSRMAAGLCGGRRGGDALRARLRLAALVMSQAGAEAPVRPVPVPASIRLRGDQHESAGPALLPPGAAARLRLQPRGGDPGVPQAQRLDPDCAMCFWGEALPSARTSTRRWTPAANGRRQGRARGAVASRAGDRRRSRR